MTATNGSASADSALEVWATTRMAGVDPTEESASDVGRALGHASYDPADVITVFMTARQSGKQRNDRAREPQPD